MVTDRFRGTHRPSHAVIRLALFAGLAPTSLWIPAEPAEAQTIVGTVLDAELGAPVPSAIVVLWSEANEEVIAGATDESGRVALSGFGPGRYRIEIRHVGYGHYLSPLVEVRSTDKTYPLEFDLVPRPTEIEGFVISVERVNQYVRSLVGLDPRSLHTPPIGRDELDRHAERGHNVVDVVRWMNLPSVQIVTGREGPCFRFRGKVCLPVFLDGASFDGSFVPMLAADVLDLVVVLLPKETVVYPNGAVLLVTRGSVR